jgi:hypothetical protein
MMHKKKLQKRNTTGQSEKRNLAFGLFFLDKNMTEEPGNTYVKSHRKLRYFPVGSPSMECGTRSNKKTNTHTHVAR